MPARLPPLPSASSVIADPQTGTVNDLWYRVLAGLLLVVSEQQKRIEILRKGLDEVRQNPDTIYPTTNFED